MRMRRALEMHGKLHAPARVFLEKVLTNRLSKRKILLYTGFYMRYMLK